MRCQCAIILATLLVACLAASAPGNGGRPGSDRILLRDLSAITLHQGHMTQGRRSSPVAQLMCVGGTAGCTAFTPNVVQCRNQGWDGYDVQWKCETDMDYAYRFGRISVSCEGYEYPDDPYILRGSCGIEYTIDLTEKGAQQEAARKRRPPPPPPPIPSQPKPVPTKPVADHRKGFVGFIGFVFISFRVSACLFGDPNRQAGGDNLSRSNYPAAKSPAPGFRPKYTAGLDRAAPSRCPTATTAGATAAHGFSFKTTTGVGNEAGAFLTGAATAGVVGYMLGSSSRNDENNSNRGFTFKTRPESADAREPSAPLISFGSVLSGTRTAAGYGGTTRRRPENPEPVQPAPSSSPDQSTGSRTAAGYGGTTRRRPENPEPVQPAPSLSPDKSTSTRTTVGYGGTTRRRSEDPEPEPSPSPDQSTDTWTTAGYGGTTRR